ncbi:MAG TPA: phosphatase PAP2 family protein [Terriglobales bacterium]|nr:phosphatase PAP2 family protein [Terriglobales bacterium]
MQSIKLFSRHPARVCVRISRVVLIGFLPAVSFAQPVQPSPEPQVPSQMEQQSSSKPAPELPSAPELQLPAASGQCTLRAPTHCFIGMAKDQKGILTSPMRLRKKDLVWIAPAAAATGAAFAFDHTAMNNVSTDPSRVAAFRRVSNLTGIYIPVGFAGSALVGGAIRHDEHLRETGALAMTAMADTQLLTSFLKYSTSRSRPQTNGVGTDSGEFWPGGAHFSADSFPSGHTANAFAVAHVIADEYPGWKVKLAVYGLAAATGFERVLGREHFPSDVLVGGGIGYLVGGYVFDHHSARSKTHVAFAPMVGRGGAGVSVRISKGDD